MAEPAYFHSLGCIHRVNRNTMTMHSALAVNVCDALSQSLFVREEEKF